MKYVCYEDVVADSYTVVVAARGLETLLGDKANQEETV
jgi:hypothetical protein